MIELKNKVILIISPEAWGTNFVSKHHYAVELVKRGNTVFFLNPPGKSWDITTTKQGVHVVDYVPRFRGVGKLPAFIAAFVTRRAVFKLEQFVKQSFDIIWNFDSSRFFNLAQLPKRIYKIQHIVDLNQNFYRDKGAQTSNLCLATTDFIVRELLKHNKNTHKIHHGAHNANFSSECVPLGVDIKESLKVGYVGNLSIPYLDWKLIFELIEKNKNTAFVFIGPFGKSNLSASDDINPYLERAKECSNAYFLGGRPSAQIPGLLKNFDIQLVVYRADEYKEQLASPHKFMEYLAAGNVILTTYTDEYKDKRHLVEMIEVGGDLLECFKLVLENLTHHNKEDKVQERINFAHEHTYEKQISRIEKLIKNNC